MKLAFDIDGVIVEVMPSEKIFEAKPIQKNIDAINKLYDDGHTIVIYTARGMRRLKGQSHLIPCEYYEKTKKQLDDYKVKYHHIVFGKLDYDLFLDDKVFNINDFDNFFKNIK